MLRNVLVISNGGLVLFSKEFVNAALEQPSLVGSLLTAMLEFSTNNVGAPVCYIELSNIAVSICSSHKNEPDSASHSARSDSTLQSTARRRSEHWSYDSDNTPSVTPKATPRRSGSLICALFHDVEDGPELGRLIASEILAAFRQQFATSLAKIGGGTPHINLNEFDAFHALIPGIISGLVRPVLARLCRKRGIMLALLLLQDSQVVHCTAENVDSLAVGASLVAITTLAEDTMNLRDDGFRRVTINNTARASRLIILRLPCPDTPACLLVDCQSSVSSRTCEGAIHEASSLCAKVLRLISSFNE